MTKFEEKLAQIIRERQGHLPSVNSEEVLHNLANELLATLNKPMEGQREDAEKELKREMREYLLRYSTYPCMTVGDEEMLKVARHFANWRQQQLMKDAIDGRITVNKYTKKKTLVGFNPSCWEIQKFKSHDKVKIIILKEE